MPEKIHVKLVVYDVLGREVAKIIDEELDAGKHKVNFNGGDLSSGIYFYVLNADKFKNVKKMILVK